MSYQFTSTKPSTRPPKRDNSCFCQFKNKVYIFGGVLFGEKIGVPIESNDFWEFDLKSDQFAKIDRKSDQKEKTQWPSTRANSAISGVSVNGNDYIYLFGGISQEKGWLDDLWRFDLGNRTWEKVEVKDNGNQPTERNMHSMVTFQKNGKDCLLLVGGFGPYKPILSHITNNTGGGSSSSKTEEADDWEDCSDDGLNNASKTQEAFQLTRMNDVFIFDPSSSTWTFITDSDGCRPSKRAAHKMVYLLSTKSCILFGGKGDTSRLSDIWKFDTASYLWKEITPNQDPNSYSNLGPQDTPKLTPRSFHEITADLEDNQVFLHGGRDNNDQHIDQIHLIYDHEEFTEENKQAYFNPWKIDFRTNNLQTKQNMEMGNHMFFVFDNVKRRFVIYGGSNKFDREYGMCGEYYDDLIVGVQDCKRMKISEDVQKSDVGDKIEQVKKVDESEKENLPTMG